MIERPRARRYPFAASIDLVEMQSEREIREQTIDLSEFGCQVHVHTPLASGARVHLRIIHRGSVFAAQGNVVNVQKNSMGVVFTKIEEKDQAVLEKWLADAREAHERASGTPRVSR